ncbi:MAG: GHKL domain-containing protein [Clostridiales bacterium]|jgi:hypothetical protein|nr:GHKL domain-containing protein [Clostridiales bacterium]
MEILRPMLELIVILPSAVLCYLPMKDHLKIPWWKLALWGLPALLVWAAAGGAVCWSCGWRSSLWLLPSLLVLAPLVCRTAKLSVWKSGSIVLAVCGVMSCIKNLAIFSDALLAPDNRSPWLTLPAAGIYVLMCWALVGLLWYPSTHAARWLLQEMEMPGTWYVFWILPVTFVGLNLFLYPMDYATLYTNRMMMIYPVVVLALLGLMLFCYGLFYVLARGLGKNMRLQQENDFLQLQAAQYRALRQTISEVRQARHDLHHHIHALSALAERGDLDGLRKYLAPWQSKNPLRELSFCRNPAVDAVVNYYAMRFQEREVSFSCRLQLPEQLPVAEMDVCVVLSNLLENALEANEKLPCEQRNVSLHSEMHEGNIVLLWVENPYEGTITETDGKFQSGKRQGTGVGIQSVRQIAGKNGGTCQFAYDQGRFRANVMLRGDNTQSKRKK